MVRSPYRLNIHIHQNAKHYGPTYYGLFIIPDVQAKLFFYTLRTYKGTYSVSTMLSKNLPADSIHSTIDYSNNIENNKQIR